jgi:phosphoglucomutase
MGISPLAGKPAAPELLVNVPKLITAYYSDIPDIMVPCSWGRIHMETII